MRKLKTLWRSALSPRVCEELETWIGVLLALGAAVLLFVTLKSQAAYADEFPRDVGAPTLLFQAADGGYAAAAPLQTDLRISVAGVVARVRVAQRFRNTGGSYVEAVYALPLPDDAAVDRLAMQVGERVIEGEIHERAARRPHLWRSARRGPAREPRAANERESVHDGRREHRAGRDHRHHDRVPADGALRRRRVQPAGAADADAALRCVRHAGRLRRARLGLVPERGGARSPVAAGARAPRGTKRTSTRCSRPACHSSGSAAAATS